MFCFALSLPRTQPIAGVKYAIQILLLPAFLKWILALDRDFTSQRPRPFQLLISILVVFWVASNLRAPISAVGPVIGAIIDSLHLSNFESSLITSIPLVMFAACSALVSKFAAGKDLGKVLILGLLVLGLGLVLRVWGSFFALMLGSVLVGTGICVGNVLLPGYIKSNVPQYLGMLTGLFAVAMNLTAAIASGYSIRIGEWTHMGWRGSLGVWIVFILVALVVLCIDLLFQKRKGTAGAMQPQDSGASIFGSRQAWNISCYMGLQSIVYYSIVSWLPTVLIAYGMPEAETGWVLFTFQMATIPLTFIGPMIANKMKHQRPLIVFIIVLMALSLVLLACARLDYVYIAATLLGISNGLAFSLCLLFFSIRTRNTSQAIRLSGMSQSIGYLVAAFGPPVFGSLHQWDASWSSSFCFLLLCVALLAYFGWHAAGNKYV